MNTFYFITRNIFSTEPQSSALYFKKALLCGSVVIKKSIAEAGVKWIL